MEAIALFINKHGGNVARVTADGVEVWTLVGWPGTDDGLCMEYQGVTRTWRGARELLGY